MKILPISLYLLFLTSCVQANLVKQEICPQAEYSFKILHNQLITDYGFTYHEFSQRDQNIIVSLYNESPPKDNVRPDFVGFFMLEGKSEVFIAMVVNDCIINYGKASMSELDHLLNGVYI